MLTRLATAVGVVAVGVTTGFVASPTPSVSATGTLAAAEQTASQFVRAFESFSYRDPGAKTAVATLATAPLAAALTSPSQAAVGPALVAEKFTATATVTGFEVESDTPTAVDLLARTDIRTTTVTGASSSSRLVPVALAAAPSGWLVSAVDGLTATATESAPPGLPGSASPGIPTPGSSTTTAGPGGAAAVAPPAAPPVPAVGDIPAAYVTWMKAAVATECPGLSWTVLAGIGKVESDFGKSTLPGVSSGANAMGAQGPMQFEPATFAAYRTVAPGGADPSSPYDPADAIYSAARLLCADGGGDPAHLYAAIFDYNHSDAYVSLVLAYADEYAGLAPTGAGPAVVERGLGSVILADAEAYLGTPYVWGGENPTSGFDCSGLVQWVYAEAGISLPRVAQNQYDHGPHLPSGATLYPGDLVFFGTGASGVEHVGIYTGNGEMIDAPYTGAVVRFDRLAAVPLAFVGATRPEIPDLTVGAGVPVIGAASPSAGDPAPGSVDRRGQGHGAGHPSPAGGTPRSGPTGSKTPGGHHPTTTTVPPTTTTVPGSTPTGPGRHHHPTTITDPPTTTTVPGTPTTTVPGRHHPPGTTTTTTTTTVPVTTTTTTVPTTTVPTTSAPEPAPPNPARPGRHHRNGG